MNVNFDVFPREYEHAVTVGSLDSDTKSDTKKEGILELLSVHLQRVDDTVESTTDVLFVFAFVFDYS